MRYLWLNANNPKDMLSELPTDLKLSTEDTNKILSEINQIINQRFQLTISAITVFGVFIAWTIPKDLKPGEASETNDFLFAAPILLLIFLFLLFIYSHYLRNMVSILSIYLRITKTSKWEGDYKLFSGNKRIDYTSIENVIFLVLGLITSTFPFLLCWISKLEFPLSPLVWSTLIFFGVSYSIAVFGISFLNWRDKNQKNEDRWNELKKANQLLL